MVRLDVNVRLDDRIYAEELRMRLKLKSMSECLQDRKNGRECLVYWTQKLQGQ